MKKIILTTVAVTLSTVSLLAQTVLEDNIENYPQTVKIEMTQKFIAAPTVEDDYENYNTGGNKVKFASSKELIDIHDLTNSRSAIYDKKVLSKTVIYDSKSDTYN